MKNSKSEKIVPGILQGICILTLISFKDGNSKKKCIYSTITLGKFIFAYLNCVLFQGCFPSRVDLARK